MISFSASVAFIATASLLFQSVNGSPVAPESGDAERLAARASSYAITGIKGSVQPRKEVRILAQDSVSWNLFLLAMNQFMSTDENDKLSWYQIAGIHGQPFVPWDNVQKTSTQTDWDGYCPHGSILFGTWHRPYVALVEQIMQSNAVAIANKFPAGSKGDKYRTAAANLRFPYWDWATKSANGKILPPSVTQATVQVTFPNGTTTKINNPLYSYRFRNKGPSGFDPSPMDQLQQTVRFATPENAAAVSNMNGLETAFQNGFSGVRNALGVLISKYQTFNYFANGISGSIQSVEGIHNGIHSTFGDDTHTGHMPWLTVAAFDPIFFLHHCNVDRLIAILQAIWPNTYVVRSTSQGDGTFTINTNSAQDANTKLKPFHKNANGDFWTSAMVRDTKVFGYTYDDLLSHPDNASLVAYMNQQYAPSSGLSASSNRAGKVNVAVKPKDYLANVTLLRSALNGPYSVDFFLGQLPSDPHTWRSSSSYVGSYSALTVPGMISHSLTSATVMLTEALAKAFNAGQLAGTDENNVVAYMKQNLYWRVVKDGAIVPANQVPNLNVTVQSTQVQPASSDSQFPQWVGPMVAYPNITGQ